jgi:hypothetical protein
MTLRRVALDDYFMDNIDPIYEITWEYVQKYRKLEKNGHHEAYADDDGPIFAVGIYELWDGVGTIWILLDQRAPRYLKSMLKICRDGIPKAWDVGYKRLQGEFHEMIPTLSLAEKCGFEVEGYLRNYGLGGSGNYFMCAKVKQ